MVSRRGLIIALRPINKGLLTNVGYTKTPKKIVNMRWKIENILNSYVGICVYQHGATVADLSNACPKLKSKIKSFIILAVLRQSVQRSLRGPSSRHCARTTQLLSKKCCRGGEALAMRPDNTAPFEEMLQRWRGVGNTVSDVTDPRY